ncbi:hypothetical protein MANES_05G070350v8 [Manihot esculenta]|uniref:Uncharacterized protein n=1 Tax=Manihot esculenta TaxID=3983 RepID=A0ACB7HQ74_MANES|nr:hypothetical protein MANES_05G070350v8 [Manihot esculenta]
MSTFNSSEDVASCKATTVSQPSSTTQPANSSTHSQLEPSIPINPSHSLPAASNPTVSLPPISNLGKKMKLTSTVWDHFEKVHHSGNDWAICSYCKTSLKANSKNGTKSLHNHIEKCAKKGNQDIVKCLEKQKQISMDIRNDGKLACAIILHEYPLSITEHVGFRKFVASLQPLFKMASRNSIKKYILNIYDVEFNKLYKSLEKLKSRIAITTDLWTSNQKKGYMSITAHYIDDFWVLQNWILRFVYVPTPHTKEELAKYLMEAFSKWNIETKISTITIDNCSTNDGMVSIVVDKLFGDLLCDGAVLHMRCCAHILNLVVKDGLATIESSLSRIRDSVVFWVASPQRVEKFEEMARQLKITCTKKLSLDCKTRWNSTYHMLQTAIEYKDIFPRLKIREKSYKDVPTYDDWEMAKRVAEKLETFHSITEIFSGRKYPTSNCFFISICQLRNSIVEWMSSDDDVIKSMSARMFENFEKYWSVVHIVLAVAVILDPRYKIKVVEYYFPIIYCDNASNEIEQVKVTCYNLLNDYQSRAFKPKSQSSSSVPPISISENQGSLKKDFSNLVAFLNSSSTSVYVKSELDHYLEEPVLPWMQEFDILNWWKTNGIKYPTLQMIARDFFVVPVSSVASEFAFSTGGRVVSIHRSRLHEDTLEALMCSQNWLWSEIEAGCSNESKSCLWDAEDDVN